MVQGGPLVQIAVIVASVLGLWVGARLLVDAVVRLARRFGLSDLVIGLTVVAAGTSTPELAVSLDAAFKGLGDIAVANVLGSNIYNLAFILGIVSFVRVIPVTSSLVHRDGVALLASTAAVGLALWDVHISRLEGLLLASAFAAYTAYLLRVEGGDDAAVETPDDDPLTRTAPPSFRGRDALLLVGGLALVLISGDYMVLAASALARGAGISELVIGGTIVAAGTSTPEFAVSLIALKRGSFGVSVGNVVGSNIYNATGILGLAALVRPLTTTSAALSTLAWLAGVSVLMVAALWSRKELSRLEGGLFALSELVRWALGLLR